jgi:L-2-amino-thiazoline-4-carboxylic acid hydrolase
MSQKIREVPMSKRFFPGLLPIVGDEKYQQIVARYRALFSNHDLPGNPNLQWHLIEGILPGLAFYQILRKSGETQENALAMIDQAFEQLFSDNFARMKKLGRLSFIYPVLRKFIKPAMRQYPPEGWKIDWLQNDRNAIRFDMKSCFYFDTFSKYGAPELTASFCRVDDLTYGNMSSHIRWQRSRTIARGEAYCDFCFLPVKEQPQG